MKKFYSFLFAAVALVGFAACNSDSTEEPTPANKEVGKVEFTANIDDSRTELGADFSVTWSDYNETIAIVSNGKAYKFTVKEGSLSNNNKSATFVYEGDDFVASENMTAVYPYNAEGEVTIKTEQNGTFGDAMVMSGVAKDGVVTFNTHNTVILTFTVPAACKEVKINNTVVKADFAPETTYYASVEDGTNNLEVRIDGYLSKKAATKAALEKGNVYKLGVLPAPVESDWGIKGAFTDGNNWNTHVKMYKETESLFVVKNVQGKDKEFKITDGNTWLGGDFALLNKWCNTFDGPNLKLPAEKCDIYFDINEKIFCIVEAGAKVPEIPYLYLNVKFDDWFNDNARFAVCFMNDDKSKQHWYSFNGLTKENRIGSVPCFGGYKYVVFCRMNGSNSTNNWDNRWNQTQDEEIPANGNNMATITDWGSCSWSKK